jgi:hypothetical protein
MKLSLIIVLAGAILFAADPAEELQIAARRGQTAEVKRLIEAGAPIESKNTYGATPLYMAVFNGHTETALLLLAKGANPNVSDTFYKSSVLAGALQKGQVELVKALIARGAAPEVRLLNMAVAQSDPAVLSALLTYNKWSAADLTNALKAALEAKKDGAADVLRKAGASEPKTVEVPAATLQSYAGDYASATLPLGIRISVDGGRLQGQADGQQQFTLSTESATEFSFTPANLRLVFGGTDTFTLHQGGQQHVYTRKGGSK